MPQFKRSDLEHFFASARAPKESEKTIHWPSLELERSFQKLWRELNAARARGAEYRRMTAAGFNVFDFIEPNENALSDIFAFFLQPNGSHAQGEVFLRLLLRQIKPELALDLKHARVHREALTYLIPNKSRRLDMLITTDDFVVGFENKKFAKEGPNQVKDYYDHLERLAGLRSWCLVFLTFRGGEADSIDQKGAQERKNEGQLQCWSWERDIPIWLAACKSCCGADKVRHFLDDFGAYIRQFLSTKTASADDDACE